jgi:hypothetical protein
LKSRLNHVMIISHIDVELDAEKMEGAKHRARKISERKSFQDFAWESLMK